MNSLENLGIKLPNILIPNNIDTSTWSVIACDQYTQDKEYWEKVKASVKNKPSTLNLILPEIYLEQENKAELIKKINMTMTEYLSASIFKEYPESSMYIERTFPDGRTRKGFVTAIDLEKYDWKSNSKSLIRATEATIKERIPARKAIRENASLELPHIMLLINDKNNLLMTTAKDIAEKSPCYSGSLMQNGGSIKGFNINKNNCEEKIKAALEKIADENTCKDGSIFLFAVGDGNHSLASAKAVWEDAKANGAEMDSALRYALVEIVNIYDTALEFKPIHRVLFNTDKNDLTKFLESKLKIEHEEIAPNVLKLAFKTESKELLISHLQPVLDEYLTIHKESKIDYIHGDDEVKKITETNPNCTGLLLEDVSKDGFFTTIANRGALPRKSFSMGEADEKRFYLECRKLK
ncbi:MAG: DUF1015 domain-containing protein [Treponema sp.]|nr:DUF1015 domain-containing protein [Treponema sp.]